MPPAVGLTQLRAIGGAALPIESFSDGSDCALCHPRQAWELAGSLHAASHTDPLYRAFAEMAQREAGPDVYTSCAGCHAPAGVLAGLIPRVPEAELPARAKAGVRCDICHQVRAVCAEASPWGEPGNASLLMDPGREKSGPYAPIQGNPAHTARAAEFFQRSELCAACHTVIHPVNGLRLEHTFEEWRASPYAQRGIQCQDCHMRSIEDAQRVARTLERVPQRAASALDGPERDVGTHSFVGGNIEAERLAGGARHARLAEERLRSAAELALRAPGRARPAARVRVEVEVRNVGAGHDLPTSLTELRQMWLEVELRDSAGGVLGASGTLDATGRLPADAARLGSALHDEQGRETFKPWEATGFLWRRTVPAKGALTFPFEFTLPEHVAAGALECRARLLYRIAAPEVVAAVMGPAAFVPRTVEMARAAAAIELSAGD